MQEKVKIVCLITKFEQNFSITTRVFLFSLVK